MRLRVVFRGVNKDSCYYPSIRKPLIHPVIMQLVPDTWETRGQTIAKQVTILDFLYFYFAEKNWRSPKATEEYSNCSTCLDVQGILNSLCAQAGVWVPCEFTCSCCSPQEDEKSREGTDWGQCATPLTTPLKEQGTFPVPYPSSTTDQPEFPGKVLTNILEKEVELGWGKDWRGRGKETEKRGFLLSLEINDAVAFYYLCRR